MEGTKHTKECRSSSNSKILRATGDDTDLSRSRKCRVPCRDSAIRDGGRCLQALSARRSQVKRPVTPEDLPVRVPLLLGLTCLAWLLPNGTRLAATVKISTSRESPPGTKAFLRPWAGLTSGKCLCTPGRLSEK